MAKGVSNIGKGAAEGLAKTFIEKLLGGAANKGGEILLEKINKAFDAAPRKMLLVLIAKLIDANAQTSLYARIDSAIEAGKDDALASILCKVLELDDESAILAELTRLGNLGDKAFDREYEFVKIAKVQQVGKRLKNTTDRVVEKSKDKLKIIDLEAQTATRKAINKIYKIALRIKADNDTIDSEEISQVTLKASQKLNNWAGNFLKNS